MWSGGASGRARATETPFDKLRTRWLGSGRGGWARDGGDWDDHQMADVVIVPGLGVRSYVEPAAAALRERGHRVELRRAPAWRGEPADLRLYGERLAAEFRRAHRDVDLLIGLSVGTQAAAVAAAACPVGHVLLVSPTVDPARRSRRRLIAAWLQPDGHPDSPTVREQVPDWWQAGPLRLYHGLVSATQVHLEAVVPRIAAPVAIVHGEHDTLSPHTFAAALAALGPQLIEMPGAPHSWPVGDHARFVELVDRLVNV
jgi:pimeloyl-ACP methyl ester carboxylesterase